MTIAELATRLKRPKVAIYRWIHTGVKIRGESVRLAAVRIGGRLTVRKAAWREFVAACNPDAPPDRVNEDREGAAANARAAARFGTTIKHQ